MRHLALAIALLASGCTDDTAAPAGILAPPPKDAGFQLSLRHSLQPGEEIHWCKYIVMDKTVDVAKFDHAYDHGHHVLVYTTPFTPDTIPIKTDFNCEAGANEQFNGVAYTGATPEGSLALPDGVGFHFDKGQVLLLEGHYLDVTDAPVDAEVAVNFWTLASPPAQQASTLFFYDNNISVPANGDATATMSCEISQPISVMSLLSHMHSRGVHYHADLVMQGLANQPLLDTDQWLNPEPTVLPTPMTLPAGARVDYSCNYHDTTGTAVVEGPSKTNNEMCMLIGVYWPRLDWGHELCAAPGSGSRYDGTTTCMQSLSCVQSATDPIAAEQCWTNTCRASSQPLDNVQSCIFQNCINPGLCSGPDCGGCAFTNCQTQIGACQAAGC